MNHFQTLSMYVSPFPKAPFFNTSTQDRYRELMHVSRQWRDIQIRAQFGFGHDTHNIPGDGDLAEFCPACPQPGVNLPQNWHQEKDQ